MVRPVILQRRARRPQVELGVGRLKPYTEARYSLLLRRFEIFSAGHGSPGFEGLGHVWSLTGTLDLGFAFLAAWL